MADPSRTPRLPPHHPSLLRQNPPSMTPQDLMIAANEDPQAILDYINNLEHENMRLRHELLSSKDEMHNVIQQSLHAITENVTLMLNVTKGSLVDIQKNFLKIGNTRSGNESDFIKPAVLRHYREGETCRQSTRNEAAVAGILNKNRTDVLTSPYSPAAGHYSELHLSLSPRNKGTIANYTPTKAGSSSGSMFNSFGGQANTLLPPSTTHAIQRHAPRSAIAETSSVGANSHPSVLIFPGPRSSKVNFQPHSTTTIVEPSPVRVGASPTSVTQFQKYNEAPITRVGLAVRSDSQQNVRNLDSKAATDEFLAYMTDSHKQPRSYMDNTRQSTRADTETSSDTFVTAKESSEPKGEDSTINSTLIRPSGPLIKYDLDFLKMIGAACKKQANPFQGNKDEELKPVLEWEGDKYTRSLRLPPRRFSRGDSRPTGFA